MDTMKRSLWHKVTSYVLTAFMMMQLTLPSVASAMTSISNSQLNDELTAEQMFMRSALAPYLYERSRYIPKLPSSYANQTIEELHAKLKANHTSKLKSEIATDWIPISGGITIFIPKERTIYPLYKQVGDKFVQRKVVGNQIKRLIGRTYYKSGFTSEQAQIHQLYTNAYTLASKTTFKYQLGDTLPEGIADTLKTDFIWPESRNIGGQYVLVPVVHLQTATVDKKGIDGTHTVEFKKSNATFRSAKISNADLKLQNETVFRTINDLVIGTKSSISIDDSAARIYAGVSFIDNGSGSVQGVASGTLYNYGQINSARNVDIVAGNYQQKTFVHRFKTAYGYEDRLGSISAINAGGGISIRTYGDILLEGATVAANGGDIKINADGSIRIGAVALENSSSFKVKGGKKNAQGVNYVQSILSAQDNISLYAAGIIEINASELHAEKGAIEILAQNGIYILNEFDQSSSNMDRKWRKTTETEQQFETIAIRSVLEAGKGVTIASDYGDITLKATKITSGDGTEISAHNGRVNLLLAKEQDHYYYNKVRKGLWKIKTETKQDNEDKAVYNEIIGGVKVHATHGITLEMGRYDGQSISEVVSNLSGTKALSWMADIYNDPQYACPPPSLPTAPDGYSEYAYKAMQADPAFQQCDSLLEVVYTKLENIHIHEKTSQLSPAAMAIIAIAVSVAMGPGGAGWIGSKGAIATAVGQGTFSAAALSAGAATLATQAATSLANGEGIDGAIKSITDSDNLRALAISMATAGVLSQLDGIEFFDSIVSDATAASAESLINLGNQAAQVVISSAVTAGIDTLISGRSLSTLGDTFVAALKAQAINEIGKGITSDIEQSNLSEAIKYIAHAATGCLLANVKSTTGGNSQECAAAAAGAVAAKYVASQYDPKIDDLTAQGEQAAQWLNKHIGGIDATQMSQEEISYYLNTHKISPAELAQWTSMQQAMSELNDIQAAGADISRLIAGLSAFVAKGTANAINSAANNGSNIAQGAAFREMSLEYKRATVLLSVLERHHVLQNARMTEFSVEELLEDGIKLPSAFSHGALASKKITGREAALLHEIAIMEILTSGSPIEKAKLVEEYGDVVLGSFSSSDDQILSFNWKGFGEDAAVRGAVAVFLDMRSFMNEPRMNDAQGIEQLRSILNHRWNRYLDSEELISALESFGAASLYTKIATSHLKSSLRRGSRELVLEEVIKQHKKKFVDDLQERSRYLLDVADNATPKPSPLYRNRVAIAKAVVPGRPHSATEEFFNFGGNASTIPRIVSKTKGAIIESADGEFLYVKNADKYLEYIEENFYKGAESLDPRLRVEIKAYLDHAQATNLPITRGKADAPGLHAEVRAVNAILKENPGISFSQISIATFRMQKPTKPDAGKPFTACQNCTGILKRFDILTGTTK